MGDKRKRAKRTLRSATKPPELYPGHAADLAKQAKRNRAIEVAAANPFAGPLAKAFAEGPLKLGGYTIREFVPIDAAILRRLKSPFYQQVLEALKPKEARKPTRVEDFQEFEVIYLFTRPCAEAEAKLNEGRAAYALAARAAFGGNPRINLSLYHQLYSACASRVVKAFSTALSYSAADGGEDGAVFTRPPARRMTGSAGG